jgi:hypothetical protein
MSQSQNPLSSAAGPLDLTASLNAAVFTARNLTSTEVSSNVAESATNTVDDFVPFRPKNLKESGLAPSDLSPLLLKFLYLHGVQSGRRIADQVKLPFEVVDPVLMELKSDLLVSIKSSSMVGDYIFELTPKGHDQAKLHLDRSTYCGAAPVNLPDYRNAVRRQSVRNARPTFEDVQNSLHGLIASKFVISQLGQAVNSGRSMFFYGPPGNGKSTIARRLIQCLGRHIWIPRSISISGEIVRLFDPIVHQESPLPQSEGLTRSTEMDERWVRIQRPCIVVGGELTLEHLEAKHNFSTGIIESPIHLKSNCGCLVVDDFGRQKVNVDELLNRWIIPMESGCDYISLPSGRQVQIPFDQLLIFSTNISPQMLCDEAFLRRIPYKIEIFNPTEPQFRQLFNQLFKQFDVLTDPDVLDYLIEHQYKRVGRPFRFCHPQDLLFQARDFCEFHRKPWTFNKEIAELACMNYFSGVIHDETKSTNVTHRRAGTETEVK